MDSSGELTPIETVRMTLDADAACCENCAAETAPALAALTTIETELAELSKGNVREQRDIIRCLTSERDEAVAALRDIAQREGDSFSHEVARQSLRRIAARLSAPKEPDKRCGLCGERWPCGDAVMDNGDHFAAAPKEPE